MRRRTSLPGEYLSNWPMLARRGRSGCPALAAQECGGMPPLGERQGRGNRKQQRN